MLNFGVFVYADITFLLLMQTFLYFYVNVTFFLILSANVTFSFFMLIVCAFLC